ncbi:MAG: class I SAM-dependent methyltransferase [Calditrichaeota bacterium]|nr:MAG: class I SAM-dependent methyltransferase [Calditrichota bacterium]
MDKKNIKYYDAFSESYEVERHKGYHKMLDDLETQIVYKYLKESSNVLELGCGTGLILQRVKDRCKNSFGIDISLGMLKKAKPKKLNKILQGDLTALPYKDDTFDLLYSFKVLAHVKEMKKAFSEFDRVLSKDGVMILEFYNKSSIRYLVKMLKSPTNTSKEFDDEAILTRYDSKNELKKLIGNDFHIEAIRGVRIFTVVAQLYKIPIISNIIDFLERKLCDSFLGNFGGFLILIIKRKN